MHGLRLLGMVALLGMTPGAAVGQDLSPFPFAFEPISASRMMADVARLSDRRLHGRLTGTQDDYQSATMVATRLSTLGLQPLMPDASWFMAAEVPSVHIGPQSTLAYRLASSAFETAQVGRDYIPILDSDSIHLTAPLVFVGFGIADSAHGWNDYAGIDVRDRIVIFLRGKPDAYAPSISHADKVRMARDKGAAAFLTFTGPIVSAYEARRGIGHSPSAFYNRLDTESTLPGAWIHTDLAERLLSVGLAQMGQSLRQVQQHPSTATTRRAWDTGVVVSLAWDRTEEKGMFYNVLGLIPGADSALAGETVVLGAHRDHFGEQAGLLFAGADDNASGTAVLLEVARVLAKSQTRPARSVLFASFSGEEQGLLGSRAYTAEPPRPLSTTIVMINIDHAGVGNGRLTVGVAGVDKSVPAKSAHRAGMSDTVDLFGFFPGGDHVPFKDAGVPTVTVVSGGAHPHFHRPTDTPDTLDPAILERTARYVLGLVWRLATEGIERNR